MFHKIDKPKDVFADTPVVKNEESVIWRGFKVTCNFLYETPAMVLGLLAAAVVAHIFIPYLAVTLYALAVASLCSKLVIKLVSRLDIKWLQRLEEWSWNLKKKFSYIQTVMIVCSLIAGYLFPILGIISATVVGGYNGIIFEIEYCKKLQSLHKDRIKDENEQNVLLNLLI